MSFGSVTFFFLAILFFHYGKETDAAIRGVLRFLAALGG